MKENNSLQEMTDADLESTDFLEPMTDEDLDSTDFLDNTEDPARESSIMKDIIDGVLDKANSASAGVAQGALMGFADEAGGITQAGLDALHSIVGNSVTDVDSQLAAQGFTGSGVDTADALSLYKEGQQDTKADLEAANFANPETFLAGQLAGGITSGMLIPGGAAGKAATAAGKISQAAKAGALAGGKFGVVQGLGDSEADITGGAGDYAKDLASDAIEGATAGAVIGGALGGGLKAMGEGAKWAQNWVKDHKFTSHVKEAYEAGKKGFNINPSSIEKELSTKAPSYGFEKDIKVQELADKIHKTDKMLGKKISDTLNRAENNGTVIKIDDELETAIGKMEDLEKTFMTDTGEEAALGLDDMLARVKQAASMSEDEAAKVLAAVEEGSLPPEAARDLIAAKNGGLSPNKAKDVLNDLQVYIDHFNSKAKLGTGTKRVVKQLEDFRTMLRTKIGNEVEGYNNAASKFREFRKNVPEKLLSKKSLRTNNPQIKDLDSNSVHDRIQDVVDDTAESLAIGNKAEGAGDRVAEVKNYLNRMRESEGKNDILESLGYETGEDFGKEMTKLQEMKGALIRSKAENPLDPNRSTLSGSGVVGLGLSAGQGLGFRGINAAGRAHNLPTVKGAKSLYQLGTKALQSAADTLEKSNVKGLGRLGESLNKAIAEGNQAKKNAIIFAIAQRPDAREALGYTIDKEK